MAIYPAVPSVGEDAALGICRPVPTVSWVVEAFVIVAKIEPREIVDVAAEYQVPLFIAARPLNPEESMPVPPLVLGIAVAAHEPVVIAPVLAVTIRPLKLVTPVKAPRFIVRAGVAPPLEEPDTPWLVEIETAVTVPLLQPVMVRRPVVLAQTFVVAELPRADTRKFVVEPRAPISKEVVVALVKVCPPDQMFALDRFMPKVPVVVIVPPVRVASVATEVTVPDPPAVKQEVPLVVKQFERIGPAYVEVAVEVAKIPPTNIGLVVVEIQAPVEVDSSTWPVPGAEGTVTFTAIATNGAARRRPRRK